MKIRDPKLAEYLAEYGIVWRGWRMESLDEEVFTYQNTPELKTALAEYFAANQLARKEPEREGTGRPGHATLGDLMKSFTQSAACA